MDKAQNPQRIFLMGWNNTRPAFIKAASELQNQGHQILYWVVPYKEEIAGNKLLFPQTQFHWNGDAVNLIPPPEIDEAEFAPPGVELIEKLYETESVLTTMKKFYRQADSVLAKKHLFHRLVQYWHGVIMKLKPDIIFFVTYPHTVFDFTIYSLAKLLNIRTQMFVREKILSCWLSISDYKLGSTVLREEILKNKDKKYKIEDLSPDVLEHYKWHLNYTDSAVLPSLTECLKTFTGINKLRFRLIALIKGLTDFSIFKRLYNYLVKEIGPNMKKEYVSLQVEPDYNKKYIYVALGYQPECSSAPLGGIFADQILMIKILSYCLPHDWLIYVKEHPFQWASSSLAYSVFRYQGYYREIANIKKVKIIPLEANSHKLISNCQAIGTVNGTAGWEGLLRLKPVLLFGYVNYQYCPGVFRVKDVATCQQALEKIRPGFKVEQQSIINYLACLDKISYHLQFSREKKEFPAITEDNMSKDILSAVAAELEKTD